MKLKARPISQYQIEKHIILNKYLTDYVYGVAVSSENENEAKTLIKRGEIILEGFIAKDIIPKMSKDLNQRFCKVLFYSEVNWKVDYSEVILKALQRNSILQHYERFLDRIRFLKIKKK